MRAALMPFACLIATVTANAAAAAPPDGFVILSPAEPDVIPPPLLQQVAVFSARPAPDPAPELPPCDRQAQIDWMGGDHGVLTVECPQQWRIPIWIAVRRAAPTQDCAAADWRRCLPTSRARWRPATTPLRDAQLARRD